MKYWSQKESKADEHADVPNLNVRRPILFYPICRFISIIQQILLSTCKTTNILFLFRFEYSTGIEIGVRRSTHTVSAPLGTLPMHVRGGFILPTQDPASNTVASRKNPFGLIIALDDDDAATGSLYWDEGDSLNPLESGNYALFHFIAVNVRVVDKEENSENCRSTK